MLYKNTKLSVHSPDGDINLFDIVASILQGNVLAPYLFIIGLDYILRMSLDILKGNGLTLKRREADDTPHKVLRTQTTQRFFANTPAQAESLLYSLEQATRGKGLHAKHIKWNTCVLLWIRT